MTVRFGCGPFPKSRKRYFDTFGTVELSDTYFDPMKPSTLKKLLEEGGEPFHATVVAWRWLTQDPLDTREAAPMSLDARELGFLQPTPGNRQLWHRIADMAANGGASSVLFKTPASFSPSTRNRGASRRFGAWWIRGSARPLLHV